MRYDLSMSATEYTGEVSVGGPVDVRELTAVDIAKVAVGAFNNNAYLIRCRATGDALLIDAAAEPGRLVELSSLGGPPVTQILTTHRHDDHWQGLAALVDETAATTLAGAPDATGLPVPVTRPLAHGDVVAIGDVTVEIIALRVTRRDPSPSSTATRRRARTCSPVTASSRAVSAERRRPPTSPA